MRDWDAIARRAIVVGAVLRAVWVLVLHSPVDHVYSDMQSYVETATHLARLTPPERFDAFYPPGTRAVLAVPLALIGPDRDGLYGGALLWAALSALAPYFMWRYARYLFPAPAAALTAAFCALWPLHIVYAGYFTSETPGLAFLALSLWLIELARRRRDARAGVFAGLAAGLAGSIRPAFVLNFIVAALPLLADLRARARHAFAIATGAVLVAVIVLAHQTLIVGRPTGVGENTGLTFYLGHCDVHIVRTGPTLGVFFVSPVAAQLDRGVDVDFPTRRIWDQDFFFGEGVRCIAADGPLHARVLIRNLFDMGFSTIPWPAANEDGLRDVVRTANVAYGVALPFIVYGAIRLVRRSWRSGGGRGELTLLLHLVGVPVTALLFFGDPRFRIPYDVFGLALAASLVARRYVDASSGERAASHPDVDREHAVEEHEEGVLGGREAAREIDAVQTHVADGDREAAVGADDDSLDRAGGRVEGDGPSAREPLGAVLREVHEVAPIRPAAVQPHRSGNAEPGLATRVGAVGEDAPDAGTRDVDEAGLARGADRADQEEDAATGEHR